jgi:hypothetical protein
VIATSALTFSICALCFFNWAASVSICFCCCATVDLNSALADWLYFAFTAARFTGREKDRTK